MSDSLLMKKKLYADPLFECRRFLIQVWLRIAWMHRLQTKGDNRIQNDINIDIHIIGYIFLSYVTKRSKNENEFLNSHEKRKIL